MCLTNFACRISDTKFEKQDSEDLFSNRMDKEDLKSDLHIYTPAH